MPQNENAALDAATSRLLIDHQIGKTSGELPKYKSHKTVWALKIADIKSTAQGDDESDGSALLVPADTGYAPFKVSREYMGKHRPKVGGYFVQYEDGYKSYSPADAFESGYTRI